MEQEKTTFTEATQHVRVRVTNGDLNTTKQAHVHTDRTAPLCRGINRVLRDGFAATFDGLSVCILDTKMPVPAHESGPHVYEETLPDGSMKRFYRVGMDGHTGTFPSFFRVVDARAQQQHKLNTAHRKTRAARFTVSLPASLLKRNLPKFGTQSNVL